jgi:hypothetical protein
LRNQSLRGLVKFRKTKKKKQFYIKYFYFSANFYQTTEGLVTQEKSLVPMELDHFPLSAGLNPNGCTNESFLATKIKKTPLLGEG